MLTTSLTPCEVCGKPLARSVIVPTATLCLTIECPTLGYLRMPQ